MFFLDKNMKKTIIVLSEWDNKIHSSRLKALLFSRPLYLVGTEHGLNAAGKSMIKYRIDFTVRQP
ncbi:hypothetical protein A0O21_07745 [Streptococcus pantholopis]|uniref:Uncharacterized protein n=1 Tax=Streptococcus pantholopis TaxID=1811193 RepID=A0A172Q935_9STRE|nr:hypothetical protein A0O21_07745 [Streptococcus pantholopis]